MISETFFDLLVSSLVSWLWLLFSLLLFIDLYWSPNADISEWIRAKQSTSGVGPIHRAQAVAECFDEYENYSNHKLQYFLQL